MDGLREDLTEEDLAYGFFPEEDFYLDENGDPVFYLQPGFAEDSGQLTVIPIFRGGDSGRDVKGLRQDNTDDGKKR